MTFVYVGFALYGIFHLYQQWRIERIDCNMALTQSDIDADTADVTALKTAFDTFKDATIAKIADLEKKVGLGLSGDALQAAIADLKTDLGTTSPF